MYLKHKKKLCLIISMISRAIIYVHCADILSDTSDLISILDIFSNPHILSITVGYYELDSLTIMINLEGLLPIIIWTRLLISEECLGSRDNFAQILNVLMCVRNIGQKSSISIKPNSAPDVIVFSKSRKMINSCL